jgi:Protein of unknown function (DUF1566)
MKIILSGPLRHTLRFVVISWMLLLGVSSAFCQTRFVLAAGGAEVLDVVTGLTWRRCSAGQVYSAGTCAGTATVFSHEQALVYAKGQAGWRLPNVKELFSIGDPYRTVTPENQASIDPFFFPSTSWAYAYWTSTPSRQTTANAFNVTFWGAIFVFQVDRAIEHHVRLVR